jgi:hypothetical protein
MWDGKDQLAHFPESPSSVQLSPCDKSLSLSNPNAQLVVFHPKVEER